MRIRSAEELIDWNRLEEAERNRSVNCMLRFPRRPDFYPLMRRFVCACCRDLQHFLPDPRMRQALDYIEAFFYSRGGYEKLVDARNSATIIIRQMTKRRQCLSRSYAVCLAVRDAAINDADLSFVFCCRHFESTRLPVRRQAELFQLVAQQWIEESSLGGY